VTRRARRGSLPFGLIARQWLRPLGTRTLLCIRKRWQAARSPDGTDVRLTQCCCTRDSLERGAAIIRCSFAFHRSVTVTLRLCPPNVRCVQLTHYAPPSRLLHPLDSIRNYASTHSRFFLAFLPPGYSLPENVIRINGVTTTPPPSPLVRPAFSIYF